MVSAQLLLFVIVTGLGLTTFLVAILSELADLPPGSVEAFDAGPMCKTGSSRAVR